ncbi:sugar phosphate isomerase/epimerase [Comamonas sp. NLF-1-9]|uniref:sugar phosphate isomerase/epimerase family protein n=1 Tax=Comamonas sp. NLF-1-9 TaxID=2853163 RepID=UPI001C48695D|nr:sugar phosphate isomerase/epimerase family protein [Comamonas sp. NLF-1-9]QXL84975.1 TIM barrel protein [Comamonas sp. NLF-1-9]
MGKIQLAYSTFGLTNLDFFAALDAVDAAGYEGVEVSFHRRQFNPFELGDHDLLAVRQHFARLRVQPACIATASHFFDPQRPHEPSLMALEYAARKRRIDLVRRGIHVARMLGVKLVTFGSGFVRDDHAAHPEINPTELLVESIRECLSAIHAEEDITLLIEPEPGMHIETLAQGLALMQAVDSPKFKLHIDICHAYCSEANYIEALADAAPHARYLHISDARQGWNLQIRHDSELLRFDLAHASTLVHFPDTADFLLLDPAHAIHFADGQPTPARQRRIAELLRQAGTSAPLHTVDYASLPTARGPLDDEIFTYLISVPGLSYDVLERARPAIAWLRGAQGQPLIERMVAHTRTGIVHFHEVPGEGTLDFAASFKALTDHGFDGWGAIELYHHVDDWQAALHASHRHLTPLLA